MEFLYMLADKGVIIDEHKVDVNMLDQEMLAQARTMLRVLRRGEVEACFPVKAPELVIRLEWPQWAIERFGMNTPGRVFTIGEYPDALPFFIGNVLSLPEVEADESKYSDKMSVACTLAASIAIEGKADTATLDKVLCGRPCFLATYFAPDVFYTIMETTSIFCLHFAAAMLTE